MKISTEYGLPLDIQPNILYVSVVKTTTTTPNKKDTSMTTTEKLNATAAAEEQDRQDRFNDAIMPARAICKEMKQAANEAHKAAYAAAEAYLYAAMNAAEAAQTVLTPNKKDTMTHTMTHTMQSTTAVTYAAKLVTATEVYTKALAAFAADPFAQAPTPGGFFPVWDNLVIAQRDYQVALHNKRWAEEN